jgi:RNA recognition motif-containing protein
MGIRLFVRNLSENVTAGQLEDLFGTVGNVESVVIKMEDRSGQSRRVAYVDMPNEDQGRDGIARYHGYQLDGLNLIVSEDKPHMPDPHFRVQKKPIVPKREPGSTKRSSAPRDRHRARAQALEIRRALASGQANPFDSVN